MALLVHKRELDSAITKRYTVSNNIKLKMSVKSITKECMNESVNVYSNKFVFINTYTNIMDIIICALKMFVPNEIKKSKIMKIF